ncbi:MAG: hypothetical protein KAI70_00480, partial [Candidatus Omnitrophica bacterium]|nr:hypothetical protein [Candidatus Omnitrophota bacterium]
TTCSRRATSFRSTTCSQRATSSRRTTLNSFTGGRFKEIVYNWSEYRNRKKKKRLMFGSSLE